MLVRLLRLLTGYRGQVLLAAGLGFGAAASSLGLLGVSGYLISRAALRPPILYLMVAIVAVRFFALARALLRYLERLTLHDLSFRLLAGLRVWLYGRLEPLVPSGLGEKRVGELLTRLVADVEALQDVFIRALNPPLVAALVLGVAAAVVGFLFPAALFGLVLPALGAGLGLPLVARLGARPASRRQAQLRGQLTAEVVELLAGAPELAVLGRGDDLLARMSHLDLALARTGKRLTSLAVALDGGVVAAAGIACATALALSISSPAGSQNEVWLATVGLVTLAAFDPLRSLPDAFQRLERGRVAASRVFDLADRPPPVRNPPRPLPVRPGTLALEGAWLRYQPRGPWVLAGVDLKLHPGRRVALVGPSGAGKTTLAHVLVRFLDLDHGRVTLGGLDLRECDQEEVRRLVGLCAQDAHVFDTTLYENIRLARPEATRTEVEEAARRAGLLSWICSLPRGWETPAGDSGDLLSGGQRQRLALARALLAGFPILILDEPTAHLDSATADRLLADLLSSTRGLTLLLITHRLRGLEAMDEVIVLDRGRVVQRGTPADLAARPGLYRSLLAMAGEAGQQTPVRMWERDLAIPAAHNSRRTSVGTTCGGTVGSR